MCNSLDGRQLQGLYLDRDVPTPTEIYKLGMAFENALGNEREAQDALAFVHKWRAMRYKGAGGYEAYTRESVAAVLKGDEAAHGEPTEGEVCRRLDSLPMQLVAAFSPVATVSKGATLATCRC